MCLLARGASYDKNSPPLHGAFEGLSEVGGEQPGNRFVSFVRARAVVVRWESCEIVIPPAFPFSFSPREVIPFPFPRPPVSYPASAGFIGIKKLW